MKSFSLLLSLLSIGVCVNADPIPHRHHRTRTIFTCTDSTEIPSSTSASVGASSSFISSLDSASASTSSASASASATVSSSVLLPESSSASASASASDSSSPAEILASSSSSIPSSVSSTTSSSSTPSSLTTPRLVQYVQTEHAYNNDSQTLSLLPFLTENTGVTHVIFAMTHFNGAPGNIHLNDDPYNSSIYTQAWEDAEVLQANGIKILACMGGYGDGSYNTLANDFDSYYPPLLALIRNYSLDGFDLDIEESVDVSLPVKLITALYNDMGPDFLITMAPVASAMSDPNNDGLSGFSYFDLDAQAVTSDGTKMVSWYNTQFYSGFGSPADTSTYDSIISAGWDPSRIVMGILDSPNDGSGYVDTSTVVSVIGELKAKYPTFGGVDGWEYYDAGYGDGDAQPWQWDKEIGAALAATATKRDVEVRAAAPGLPPHPFAKRDVDDLKAAGATHFEAIRALNRTSGDATAARSLYNSFVLSHKP